MKQTIAICSSITFYKDCIDIKEKLVALGYEVILPELAELMEKTGNYDLESHRETFYQGDFYGKKGKAIKDHFKKIEEADATLIVNYEKHGIKGYIGPNVLMEMSLAFYRNKPVFILNPFPQDSPFKDELMAMKPIILDNQLEKMNHYI